MPHTTPVQPFGRHAPAVGGPAPRIPEAVRQRLAVAVLLTANFTVTADFSVLNVALPHIGSSLGFSLGGLQWIATAFSLCAAGFTLSFGRLADLVGRRRLFLIGVAALGASSLAGGLADRPWILVTARVVQGLATAAVIPSALALLTTGFPDGPLRERVLGLNGALMAGGFTTGAVVGGLLTDVLDWRWAFFLNVAVAVAVLALGPAVLPTDRVEHRPRLDLPGAATATLGLLALVYGLTQAGEGSWTSPRCWAFLGAALVLTAAFVAAERRAPDPLVPLPVLRRPAVAWGNAAGVLAFATITSVVYLLTLYSQEVLGHSALWTGFAFTAMGVGSVIGGVAGPRVIAATGSRNAMIAGFAVQGAATVPLAFLGRPAGWTAVLLAATFVAGAANLVAIVAFMVTATSTLPDAQQGTATGLATMSQQIGFTLGIPAMSAVTTARLHALGDTGPDALLSALGTALAVNAAVCLVTAALLRTVLPSSVRIPAAPPSA
jgi:EmrB/QacA subfamily drug resistance transporter